MKITELAIQAVKASARGDWYFLQINTDEDYIKALTRFFKRRAKRS